MRSGAVFPLQLGVVLLGALGSLVLVAPHLRARSSRQRRRARRRPWSRVDRRTRRAGAVDPRAADGDERHGTRRMSRRAPAVRTALRSPYSSSLAASSEAHSGPPFPIVSDRIVGAYRHLDLDRSGHDRRRDGGRAVLGGARGGGWREHDSRRNAGERGDPSARSRGTGARGAGGAGQRSADAPVRRAADGSRGTVCRPRRRSTGRWVARPSRRRSTRPTICGPRPASSRCTSCRSCWSAGCG